VEPQISCLVMLKFNLLFVWDYIIYVGTTYLLKVTERCFFPSPAYRESEFLFSIVYVNIKDIFTVLVGLDLV